MMDMFDLTNFGKRNSGSRPRRKIPYPVGAIFRMVCFVLVFIFGIRAKSIVACLLWLTLFVWQLIMLIQYFRKKKQENQKEYEKTVSEDDFMKQLDEQFADAEAEIKSDNKKLQNRFNNSEYNEEDATEFEEYDLSEANNENPVIYSDSEGF